MSTSINTAKSSYVDAAQHLSDIYIGQNLLRQQHWLYMHRLPWTTLHLQSQSYCVTLTRVPKAGTGIDIQER